MISRRSFITGTASSLALLATYSAHKLLDWYWAAASRKGYSPTKHGGHLDQKYQKMVNKLRGHSYGSPGAPYRWRAAFEDVIGGCFQYLDGKGNAGRYYAIEQFTHFVHVAQKIAENRDTKDEFDETEQALSGIVISTIFERDINNLFQDDLQRWQALKTTKRFVNFKIPTDAFLVDDLDFIRKFARQSFAKRWNGYVHREEKTKQIRA